MTLAQKEWAAVFCLLILLIGVALITWAAFAFDVRLGTAWVGAMLMFTAWRLGP